MHFCCHEYFCRGTDSFCFNFFSLLHGQTSVVKVRREAVGGAKKKITPREGIKTKQSITGLLLLFPDGLWVT